MSKWKSEVLNWAEEHSDGQRELKVWRELITEYLEEEYLKEDGMSDEEFKQFLKEQESFEIMAKADRNIATAQEKVGERRWVMLISAFDKWDDEDFTFQSWI